MEVPSIRLHDWIKVKSDNDDEGQDGYVFKVISNAELSVGYYQNQSKAIKENVIWTGTHWKFKNDGPSGLHLKGPDESIVKRGPNSNS